MSKFLFLISQAYRHDSTKNGQPLSEILQYDCNQRIYIEHFSFVRMYVCARAFGWIIFKWYRKEQATAF